MTHWTATILGECASKSNSRKLVFRGKTPRFIKSDKALDWQEAAILQLGTKRPASPMLGDLVLEARVYYASRRPDLDVSLVCDVLQKAGIVKNDRSFREQHLYWGLDRINPRVEVVIYPRAAEAA